MALIKSKELPSGISGEYSKVILKHLDTSSVVCSVFLFKDQTAKEAGKHPMQEQTYSWSGEENPCTIAAMNVVDKNPIKLCYEKLKTLPEFDGAQDA